MMLKNLKAKFDSFMQTLENVLFGTEEIPILTAFPVPGL